MACMQMKTKVNGIIHMIFLIISDCDLILEQHDNNVSTYEASLGSVVCMYQSIAFALSGYITGRLLPWYLPAASVSQTASCFVSRRIQCSGDLWYFLRFTFTLGGVRSEQGRS